MRFGSIAEMLTSMVPQDPRPTGTATSSDHDRPGRSAGRLAAAPVRPWPGVAAGPQGIVGQPPIRTGGWQPEEIVDRPLPAQPRISPDGRRVVFTVRPASWPDGYRRQAIWLGEPGRPARPFTAGIANDSDPAWSPDGQTIVFRSDREERGTDRLYLIALDGGEAQPLSALCGELDEPAWSPDGEVVAVLRTDPAPGASGANRPDGIIVVGANPRRQRLWSVEVATGRTRQLTFGARSIRSFCWLPDGQSIAAIATESPDIDAVYGPAELLLIPASGGIAARLATFPVMPSDPTPVTVDGVAGVAVEGNAGRADPTDGIWLVPLSGGEPRRIPIASDGSVEAIRPAQRPDRVAARLVERARGRAVAIDLATGAVHDLDRTPDRSVDSAPSLSRDGRHAAWLWSAGDAFEQVALGPVEGAERSAREVTAFGDEHAERLNPTRTVGWASSDGVRVEGILTLPRQPADGARLPLVVQIHGGPTGCWDAGLQMSWHDWSQYLASHGYAVLIPNPRGSTSYGAAFQKLLQDDVGGGEMRDVVSGAEAMVTAGIADPARLGIGGWSWGGYLAAWTVTQTTMFRASVMGAGVANLASDHGQGDMPGMNFGLFPGHPYSGAGQAAYLRPSPVTHAHAVRTPTLILHGAEDVRVRPEQGGEFHRALTTLGVPVEFVLYPREGHAITERAHQIDLLRRVLAWYDRWLLA